MKPFPIAALALTLGTLAACNQQESDTESVDDYAARVSNGTASAGQPQAQQVPPTIAQPKPGAAPGAFAAGTATDPAASRCGAPKAARFFGRVADEATRAQIVAALAPHSDIRFVEPGAVNVMPDPASTRLNVMIDVTGVIRDARCG